MTAELVPGVSIADFVRAAAPFRTEAEFRRSPFFARHGAALLELLATPRPVGASAPVTPGPAAASATPRPVGGTIGAAATTSPGPAAVSGAASATRVATPERPLRVVHWNIEKGKAFAPLLDRLATEPELRDADAWCFNEVDVGMNRSGNRDIAEELARHLGAAGYYLPNYIEATKGLADERRLPGENALGLHGVALLSRRPLGNVRCVELPAAWDYFDYAERRFGGRRALLATLDDGAGGVVLGTAHLEMRSPPAGRARQMKALLQAIDRSPSGVDPTTMAPAPPLLLSGDWNTHTFPRGARGDTLRGFFRIVGTDPARLERELLDPATREPLFRALETHGFRCPGVNDDAPTAWQELGRVEDLALLPGPLARVVLSLFRLGGRRLPLRLDWFAARGLEPVAARTLSATTAGGARASDHEPIVVSVRRSAVVGGNEAGRGGAPPR